MPIVWSHDNDARLLALLLRVQNIKVDFEAIAPEMSKVAGAEVTVSALQNRIHKIKAGIALGVKNVQGSPNKNASVDGTNAPVTPKNKGGRKKTTGSKNDKKSAASGRNDGEEKDPGGPRSSESPTTNRSKKRKIDVAAKMKEDNDDTDDEQSPKKKVKTEDAEEMVLQ